LMIQEGWISLPDTVLIAQRSRRLRLTKPAKLGRVFDRQ
jgi:hypothetical protein